MTANPYTPKPEMAQTPKPTPHKPKCNLPRVRRSSFVDDIPIAAQTYGPFDQVKPGRKSRMRLPCW